MARCQVPGIFQVFYHSSNYSIFQPRNGHAAALLPPGSAITGKYSEHFTYDQEHPDATMEQIDNILDGNICR